LSSLLFIPNKIYGDEDEFINKQSPIITLRGFINYKNNEIKEDKEEEEKEEEEKIKVDYSLNDNDYSKTTISRNNNSQKVKRKGIDNLLIDGMNHYVGVSYIEANSYNEAKYSLYKQLETVLENTRKKIVECVIIPGSSILNVVQISGNLLQSDGKANAYFGW
jgi:hypothetical protein